jgi:hypothetical protein
VFVGGLSYAIMSVLMNNFYMPFNINVMVSLSLFKCFLGKFLLNKIMLENQLVCSIDE